MKRIGYIVVFLAAAVLAAFLLLRFTPYPELAAFQNRPYSLVVNDRNGITLRVFPAQDGVKREWADLESIPKQVRQVFIRAEDSRFSLHPGIDPAAIAASALRNIRAGRTVSGASTITMQLARLVKPHRRGLPGKLAEAVDALRLEARLSKKAILELWLNNIPFGSNIEGLPAFSRARFGLPVAELDRGRAVALAVVPRRPGLYDPAVNAEAATAAAAVLAAQCGLGLDMAALASIVEEAAAEKPPFFTPHFAERVKALAEAGGLAGVSSQNRAPVRTSLDLRLQAYAEERLRAEVEQLRRNRVSNGAVLVIENKTGAVLAYAGSASWFDDGASGKIDGVMVKNQPGSCLKPFLYALALDSGFGPNEILPDIPNAFGSSEAYIPSNFNRRFNGPVRLRVALASSLNIPAVWTLEQMGVSRFEDYLVSLGFSSIAERMGTYGTGLALGNAEVRLEELVRAFSVFERGGLLIDLQWLREAAPQPASPASSAAPPAGKQVISPYAAFVIRDILSDKGSRFVGFGPAPTLATPFSAMFKTGTANQYQNIWALGASGRWTVGVWMGNFSGETIVGKTGSSIPARIASDILASLEADEGLSGSPKTAAPEAPDGVESVNICALSGMAAAAYCSGTLSEWAIRGKSPVPCSWHGPDGIAYPSEYRSWLAERLRAGSVNRGNGGIRLPRQSAVFYLDSSLPADAQAVRIETSGFGDNALVYVDNTLQGGLNPSGVFVLPLSQGRKRVVVEDDESSASVEFEVR